MRESSTAPASPPSYMRLGAHFFAVYGMFGCISPYLPIYLRDLKGISPHELGLILAAGQSGVLVMPAFMTFLADRYRLVAPLMMALFAINAVAIGTLSFVAGFWACLLCIVFTQLANQPQIALSDALFFALQAAPGARPVPYPSVRVWGTVGYIAASALLLAVFAGGGSVAAMPVVAAGVALAGLANAAGLPARLPPSNRSPAERRLPTVAALRVFARPRTALLCLGLGLIVATNSAYYGFYPLYLTEQVGIDARWVGLIATVGVSLEIGYMLAFERLRARWGLAGLMRLGAGCGVLRLAILAFLPSAGFAVGLQVMHGLTVIGVLVVPAMFLNRLAPDEARSSVQGLYVMLVVGGFAIAGHVLSGQLAGIGLLTLYRAALVTAVLGLILLIVALRGERRDEGGG